MPVRFAIWAVLLLTLPGCGTEQDEAAEAPDASVPSDAAAATDAIPECVAPLKPVLLYPSAGCDVQPQWLCMSSEAGARNIRYCLCEKGSMSDDLGWDEGALKPWVGMGMWVYPQPGCNGSASRTCSQAQYEYGTWCGCSGQSYESMAPTSPYAHEGACDGGAP